jgi:hypothetical protein
MKIRSARKSGRSVDVRTSQLGVLSHRTQIFINGAVGSLKLATYSNSNARELASGEILKIHLPIDNFSNNYEEFLLQN